VQPASAAPVWSAGSAWAPLEAAVSRDAHALAATVDTYLTLAFFYHDDDRIMVYLRRIQQLCNMKAAGGAVDRATKQRWLGLLLTQLVEQADRLPMHVQIKIMQCATGLFAHEKAYDLSLDWRPFYALLSRFHLTASTRSAAVFSAEQLYSHQITLVKLISKARRYFIGGQSNEADMKAAAEESGGWGSPVLGEGSKPALSAGEEVLSTFIPFLCPFDNAYFKSQALLCLFFPSHIHQSELQPSRPAHSGPGASVTSFKELQKLYTPFTDNLIDVCPLTVTLNMQLYSRMAKHALGVEDDDGQELMAGFVQRHRADFYSTFLQLLELDVGNQQSQNMHRHWTNYTSLVAGTHRPARLDDCAHYFAKLIAYTLHMRDDPAAAAAASNEGQAPVKSSQELLTSLLFTLRNYFHPSNSSGKAGSVLATFLARLVQFYCKRLGREIRGEAKYSKKYYLDPANLDLLLVVQPIAMQGLYSKSSTMVSACESALRHLATFHPQHILPPLISNIEQSLVDVNTSHRLMSSLQVMTSMANIIFSAETNIGAAGGANYLANMMALCLPGIDIIDPIKTSFTMTWLAVLFYSLPLIDARDGGASDDSADLPDAKKLRPSARFSLQDQHPSPDAYAEAVDAARSATFTFEEWSLSYVDALVKLLDSADKFAKKDYVDQAFARLLYKNTRSFFSALSPKLLDLVTSKLVAVLTGSHFPSAQKHYGILVHTLSLANAEKFLAKFVPAIMKKVVVNKGLSALAASELEWCVYLLGQAVKQAGGAAPCPDATAAGINSNLLLPYIDSLQQVHTLTRAHEVKAVRKVSGKLLRNLLRGLTATYPAEYRSFSPVGQWSAVSNPKHRGAGWAHWKEWGTWAPREEPYDALANIDIIWHVPTKEEMAAAAKLLQTNLQAPLQWIVNWIEGTESAASASGEEEKASAGGNVGKSDSPLERSLWQITNLLRGVQCVMGTMEGADHAAAGFTPDKEDDHDNAYSPAGADCKSRCPVVTPKRTQLAQPLDADAIAGLLATAPAAVSGMPKVTSLRTHLARIVHQAFARLRELSTGSVQQQPSTKAHVLLLKLTTQVLAGYGCNERKTHNDRVNGKYARVRLRELLSGYRNRLRPMLVQKAYDVHLSRLVDLSYYETYTADAAALIGDLQQAAVNDFTKIRSKATALLIASLRRYPQAIDGTIDAMLRVFRNEQGTSSDEVLLGCMGVLCDYSMTNWLARKWLRMSKFIHTLFLHGEKPKDDKVQLLIQQLYNNLYPAFQMKAVAIEAVDTAKPIPPAVAHLVDATKVTSRNRSIAHYNQTLARHYMTLMTFLYKHASGSLGNGDGAAANGDGSASKPAHWRYSLMSAAFFYSLSRAQHYETALAALGPSASSSGMISFHQFVTFFLKGCTSTLAPLRTISFLAVSKTLGTHALHVRGQLNAYAEQQLHADVVKTLRTLDTGATTPVDPAASLSKQGSILTFTSLGSEEEQLNTVFYDYLYSGWMGDTHNTVVCKYFGPLPSGEYAHMLPHAHFTPLSLTTPIKYPYKQLTHTALTPVAPLAPATLQAIHDFFTANSGRNLQLLTEHFVHAHPSLAPSHDGQGVERSGDGAGDQIATLVTRNVVRNKLFPTTRFNKKSHAFRMTHVTLIRGLVESNPDFLLKPAAEGQHTLLSLVADLIKAPDEADKACTAAELLCGAVLAIKHFRYAQRTACEAALLPLILTALQTCMPENLDHYGDALRHMLTNVDPRRMSWLSTALFTEALAEMPSQNFVRENQENTMINPDILDLATRTVQKRAGNKGGEGGDSPVAMTLDEPARPASTPARVPSPSSAVGLSSASPSVQLKRLRFLLPVLIEVGYRGAKLGEWLLTQFKRHGFLASPWKAVREEVAWLLFILTRNEFQLHENHPAQSPGGRVTQPASTLSVLSSPVYLRFLHYITSQLQEVRALYLEDQRHPAGSPKLHALAQAAGVGESESGALLQAQKDVAKSFLETVLTWFHATSVCGDMVFTSTMYQAVLPYVLWCAHHQDAEISAIARFAGLGAAWISAGGSALSREIAGNESRQVSPAQGVRRLQEAATIPEVNSLSLLASEPKRTALNSPSRVMDHILSCLRAAAVSAENTWHVRVAVARFLQIWIPRHSLVLSAAQLSAVESLLLDVLLVDSQVEVREAASQAFQSLVASCYPLRVPTRQEVEERAASGMDGSGLDIDGDGEGHGAPAAGIVLRPHPHIEELAKKLTKLVKDASGKKKKAAAEAAPAGKAAGAAADPMLPQRHGGLLALSGLAATHPYDVPTHLPAVLSFLAGYIEERNLSISGSLRKFFRGWMSSHKDEWPLFQRQFTQEQLDQVNAVEVAPSYFA